MYKAYISYFVSYLLNNLKRTENIREVVLFGSAARDEATKESDIDLFINLKKEDKKLNKEIDKVLEEFYKSREALLFKTKKIENKINIIVGKINEWPELKSSIESEGIVLYGQYISSNVKGKKYAIIFWSEIEKNRGAFLNKIYGFRVKSKRYLGLLQSYNGMKLGKSAILIPVENKDEILKLIRHHKVSAKILEI